MSHPSISFYVPARNAEKTLADCLAAIKQQTLRPDELFVVVDPRSSDRTLDVALASGVRVIEQEGGSLGSARNTAIKAARHRWLASCDSDVIIEPNWLECLANRCDQAVAGIGGRTLERVRGPADAWRGLHMPHHWGKFPLANPFMLVSEVIFDREALLAVGGYRDDLSYYEDSDLCQRLRDAGFELFYEPTAVATHQRVDTIQSVLDLRWKYSEYRQCPHLDTFAGLLHKAQVNREYALTTLARSLSREQAELAYISVLLFAHHLQMDLRSMFSRRPLLSASARNTARDQLLRAILAAAREQLPRLAAWIEDDLTMNGEVRADDAAVELPPAWSSYLDRAKSLTRSFFEETAELQNLLCNSATAVHARDASVRCRFEIPHRRELEERIAEQPLMPCVDDAFCRWLSREACRSVRIAGPLLPGEVAHLKPWMQQRDDSDAVTLVAHLESSAGPLCWLREINPASPRAIVCYRPPPHFVAGLDVPSAGDLAEAAAGASWNIERFETLVGATRLLLRRGQSRSS